MAKFILIDSNIAGTGGHYLEYAEQVLEIAAERGFDCILAANKAFDLASADGRGYSSRSLFPYDMWGRNLSRSLPSPNQFTADDRRYLRDYYSIGGLLWNASADLSVARHYSQQTTLPSALARRLRQVHAARVKVEALNANEDQAEQAGSEAEERALRYRRFRKVLAQKEHRSAAIPQNDLLADLLRQSRAADTYGTAIARLLAEVDIDSKDHIFVPTLSLAEARSLRDLMRRDERARRPHWSLLFRRDVYLGYSSEWPKQDWAVHEARNLFASFRPLTQSAKISFFTDTDLLTKQYDKLGSVPFRTTAIPVRTTERALAVGQPEKPWQVLVLVAEESPRSLTTLVEVIEALDLETLDRLHFHVPADTFDIERDSGDLAASRSTARARFRPFLPDAVTIGGSSHELGELLSHADVCLLIDIDPTSSPVVDFDRRQFRDMPVIAPPEFVRWLSRGGSGTGIEYSPTENTVETLVQALRSIAEQPSRPRIDNDHFSIGFLGDARAEKGFHLLPEIMDGLNSSRANGSRFFLETQVYHPNPASDIRMLRAMERVRRMPADRARIEEGALDSTAYQAIIARSDVIFNLYSRQNYVSRSSGIFVEALASLKPVLTTASTWMSAKMGDWSQDYHDHALRQSKVLAQTTFEEIDDWDFLGGPRPVQTGDGSRLDLKPGLSACSVRSIPAKANHLRIEIATAVPYADAPLNLIVAWQDGDKRTKLEVKRQLNRTVPGVISTVFPIPKDARHLWIGITIEDWAQSYLIDWARLTWHVSDVAVAEMPGGIAVLDSDEDRLIENCADALRAIERSYTAYVDSCVWAFDRWSGNQTARTLVHDLLTDPPVARGNIDRFVGREW